MMSVMSDASQPQMSSPPLWAPCSDDGAIRPAGSALPPPPPGCRYVRVSGLGIVIADDPLRRRVDRFFHVPMIVLALLVLPLLVLDYAYIRETGPEGATRGWMWWLVIGGLTLIWVAFTLEFLVKITVAEHRWEYLRRNWLDLIIIVIPLLRPLRVAALARTSRAFRLRGVGFKLARYIFTLFIGMEATNRMLERMGIHRRMPREKPEDMTRHELICEVQRLRRLSDEWAEWHKLQQAYFNGIRHAPMSDDQPIDIPEDSPDVQRSPLPASGAEPKNP